VTFEKFAREDVLRVLAEHGITGARRVETTDSTEEVILLAHEHFDRVDVDALTRALMEVIPDTKVWVAPDRPPWRGEEI